MVEAMICRSCKRDNPKGVKYCIHCGELLILEGRVQAANPDMPGKHEKIRARRERRKAIERIADENPDLAAKVLQTWLKSE